MGGIYPSLLLLTNCGHVVISIIRLHQLHNEETKCPIITKVSQAKDYCHTHLRNLHWRVCAVLTQTNVTKYDSVIVSTKIWIKVTKCFI